MPHYFYPIDDDLFHERIQPGLSRSWQQRSFEPITTLCRELLPRIREFHSAGKTLLEELADGKDLSFDRHVWRAVVGEMLLFAAEELPLLQISSKALCCLFAPSPDGGKSPIEQVLFGSRDLVFAGAYYRPDVVGWNDVDDVARLLAFLKGITPETWRPSDLAPLVDLADNEERIEELEFVRQNWAGLVEMYRQAGDNGRIMVYETD